MKKILFILGTLVFFHTAIAQQPGHWTAHSSNEPVKRHKAVERAAFPENFKLFDGNFTGLRNQLLSIVNPNALRRKTIISLPNAAGGFEEFELVEASNFDPALQAKFPEIRAYSGKGITDKSATVKLSLAPDAIQTMVFRTGSENEFIEPYSEDKKVYAVFRSQRKPGQLPWTCSTVEKQLVNGINTQVTSSSTITGRSGGNLKTLRLAQSCNGEYSNWFGATSATDVAKVLAAFNATLTRCNGVYEKDLALHLNLIDQSTSVIYYTPSTDPYTTMSSWNNQLQTTLTSVIGDANYDIGHMFGASGGGGNAGCIGCICSNGKGSGITSPADGIPQGDNFDIDYVVHEVGHQLGANHTFSMSNEGSGQNKEVGSGITIMGYAGITSQDVAPHSIDIFHATSIAQIQSNLSTKNCPVTTSITGTAPVIGALSNYTIPKSTPFALTATATDADAADVLTYCWEQNDNAGSTQTGTSSVASATKASGPNWISFSPSTSPTRLFPKLSTILAGNLISGPLPGGDAGANTEALSSVARTLNFRLTVRDNAVFSSVAPVNVGQTSYADVAVTVSSASGPFAVTAPNSAVTLPQNSQQTITWNVAGSDLTPVNCANVKISLSTDGGLTFPTVLAESTPNDGSEPVKLPATTTTQGRIKIESVGNIFFDISNANFTIGAPLNCDDVTNLNTTNITTSSATLNWNSVSGATLYTVDYKISTASSWTNITLGSATATTASLSGLAAGTVYDWRVRSTCSAGDGQYISSQFTTSAAPVTSCQSVYDVNTNGTTSGAASIPFNTNVTGLVNLKGDIDNYKFLITTGGSITLTLTTLPANYNLRLLNSSGNQVAVSQKNGSSNESITATVTAGTYYAQVFPANNAFNATSCYTLKVALGTATRLSGTVLSKTSELDVAGNRLTSVGIYPNPVRQTLSISMPAISEYATIDIFNSQGMKMISKLSAGSNRQVDVSKLAAGVYTIELKNSGGVQYRTKFIKL